MMKNVLWRLQKIRALILMVSKNIINVTEFYLSILINLNVRIELRYFEMFSSNLIS